MLQKTLRICGMFCVVVVLTGCSTVERPSIHHEAIISQIKVDVTTREEILDWLGIPNGKTVMMIQGQKHELWAYGYSRMDSHPEFSVPDINPPGLSAEDYAIMQSAGVTIALTEEGIVHGLSRHNFYANMNPSPSSNSVATSSVNDDQ